MSQLESQTLSFEQATMQLTFPDWDGGAILTILSCVSLSKKIERL
jgi:hypothetical protein